MYRSTLPHYTGPLIALGSLRSEAFEMTLSYDEIWYLGSFPPLWKDSGQISTLLMLLWFNIFTSSVQLFLCLYEVHFRNLCVWLCTLFSTRLWTNQPQSSWASHHGGRVEWRECVYMYCMLLQKTRNMHLQIPASGMMLSDVQTWFLKRFLKDRRNGSMWVPKSRAKRC